MRVRSCLGGEFHLVAQDHLRQRQDLEAEVAQLLRQCIATRDISLGRQIHRKIEESRLETRFLGHLLIQMYGKCGSVADAHHAFASITKPNLFSWNLIIVAFLENGHLQTAQDFYDCHPQRSVINSNAMISAYAQRGNLRKAKVIFDSIPEKDIVSWNTMITAYSQNGDIFSARRLFDSMRNKDLISWNSILAAYAQTGHGREAVRIFHLMEQEGLRPNHVTVLSVLTACGQSRLLDHGRWMHVRAAGLGAKTKVGNAVMDMYGKCGAVHEVKAVFDSMPDRDVVSWTTLLVGYASSGDLGYARRVFNTMPARNLVSWNCMIMAYANAGCLPEGMEIFRLMLEKNVEPDEGTFLTVIDACANAGALADGESVHRVLVGCGQLSLTVAVNGCQRTVMVSNALLSLYTKCDRMETAMEIFRGMPVRNVVTWTTMISAYAQRGDGNESIALLHRMDLDGIAPNEVTLVSALDGCVAASDLAAARRLHRRSLDTGMFAADAKVGNAIINVYGKCGRIQLARAVFQDIPRKNRISWNALLAAHAHNGLCRATLDLLAAMAVEGIEPDQITFTAVLSICAHAGLRRECWNLFVGVTTDYDIHHDVSHYVCMVDLLGRLGYLGEADELVAAMPFEPTAIVWTTLLAAARIHKRTESAANAALRAIELEQGDAAGLYILLANLWKDEEIEEP